MFIPMIPYLINHTLFFGIIFGTTGGIIEAARVDHHHRNVPVVAPTADHTDEVATK